MQLLTPLILKEFKNLERLGNVLAPLVPDKNSKKTVQVAATAKDKKPEANQIANEQIMNLLQNI